MVAIGGQHGFAVRLQQTDRAGSRSPAYGFVRRSAKCKGTTTSTKDAPCQQPPPLNRSRPSRQIPARCRRDLFPLIRPTTRRPSNCPVTLCKNQASGACRWFNPVSWLVFPRWAAAVARSVVGPVADHRVGAVSRLAQCAAGVLSGRGASWRESWEGAGVPKVALHSRTAHYPPAP